MKPCVLVVGTPRSGTSCVAGVLHHLGVRMALKEFPEPHAINPKGFFEDREMLRVLVESNECIDKPTCADAHRQIAEKRMGFAALQAAIAARIAPGVIWGCKSLLTADGVFRRAYAGPLLVIRTIRDQTAIAASAKAAMGGREQRSVAAMVSRADACVAALNSPTLVVPYEGITKDAAQWVATIAEFVGLPVNDDAVQFVDPALRHH